MLCYGSVHVSVAVRADNYWWENVWWYKRWHRMAIVTGFGSA